MKPLKILQPSNLLSRMKPWHKTIAKRALISFGVVTVIALAIWFLTPSLIIHGKAAFAPAQKRLYVIAAFYLLWLLKLLILDFDAPKPAEIDCGLRRGIVLYSRGSGKYTSVPSGRCSARVLGQRAQE